MMFVSESSTVHRPEELPAEPATPSSSSTTGLSAPVAIATWFQVIGEVPTVIELPDGAEQSDHNMSDAAVVVKLLVDMCEA
jgi:hypothetical protein